MMKTIQIHTAVPYTVEIGSGLLAEIGQKIEKNSYQKVAIIADTHVAPLYAKLVADSCILAGLEVHHYVFPAGESAKCFQNVEMIISWLTNYAFTRSDLILALGGGVCGDLAGFIASIYLRGIDYIQLPTTFLAAIDSSVGGKTAVNIPEGKNLVGSFYQPRMVICDIDTFATLPEEVFLDGVAEAIKYGCIWDETLFSQLEKPLWRSESLEEVIAHCCAIKAKVVATDETEQELRQILNFGHTFGHAVEKLSYYQIPHGKAVAIGMHLIARVGESLEITEHGTADRIQRILASYQLPYLSPFPPNELISACLNDKKRHADTINFITLPCIGNYAITPLLVADLENTLLGGISPWITAFTPEN